MPTVSWILETAQDNYIAAFPDPVLPRPTPRTYSCPQCGAQVATAEALAIHLALEHVRELPMLTVRGLQPFHGQVFRTPVGDADIHLYHCSRVSIGENGGHLRQIPVNEFHKEFSCQRHATWDIQLVHDGQDGKPPVFRSYHVRFRIPNVSDLQQIDEFFVRTLTRNELTHADLDTFESLLSFDAPAEEYGRALGDYALAILLKDSQRKSFSVVKFDEFEARMNSALDALHQIHTPVALAVSSSIRFNLNAFYPRDTSTRTDLEAAIRFFRDRTDDAQTTGGTDDGSIRLDRPMRPICPLDDMSFRLMSACIALLERVPLLPDQLEQLAHLAHGRAAISTFDLAKLHVVCAEGLVRLGFVRRASQHLREVQYGPPFGSWACRMLDRIAAVED